MTRDHFRRCLRLRHPAAGTLFATAAAVLSAALPFARPAAAQGEGAEPPAPAPAPGPVKPATPPPPAPPPILTEPAAGTGRPGDLRGGITSTSPVPATSILYPGSTVRRFRGKDNFGWQTDLDLRYRNANRETRGTYVSAARVTFDWVRANPTDLDERGGFRAQLFLEDEVTGGTALSQLRPSEFYAYYTFLSGGVSARVRAGQFVLPFGLLATDDVPLQPIQPLYYQSLGVRVDAGVMLEGVYGPFRYAGAITTGSGPNRSDPDGDKVVMFRLARTVETKALGRGKDYGVFEVGGSLLSGRLPVTSFDYSLPPSGTLPPGPTRTASGFIKKTRFAGDGSYLRGPLSLRGEVVFGSDDDEAVAGYFAQGDWRFADRFTATAFRKWWAFPVKPQETATTGIGVNYRLREDLWLRLLYEYERNVPPRADDGTLRDAFVIKRLTLQTRFSF